LALSDLLRLALNQSDKQEISLREELHFVQRYTELQQTRFGDKLRFEQEIDSAALDCAVPTLLLQPLVENAIRHGIEPADQPGTIRLSAHRQNGNLVLSVEDDGVGLAPKANLSSEPQRELSESHRTGIGLANLQARLQTLYGAASAFELRPRPVRGVAVRIQIPWRILPQGQSLSTAT
jgi:two-component system LytT family sensor kinase